MEHELEACRLESMHDLHVEEECQPFKKRKQYPVILELFLEQLNQTRGKIDQRHSPARWIVR
jgi:hypothetical protein